MEILKGDEQQFVASEIASNTSITRSRTPDRSPVLPIPVQDLATIIGDNMDNPQIKPWVNHYQDGEIPVCSLSKQKIEFLSPPARYRRERRLAETLSKRDIQERVQRTPTVSVKVEFEGQPVEMELLPHQAAVFMTEVAEDGTIVNKETGEPMYPDILSRIDQQTTDSDEKENVINDIPDSSNIDPIKGIEATSELTEEEKDKLERVREAIKQIESKPIVKHWATKSKKIQQKSSKNVVRGPGRYASKSK